MKTIIQHTILPIGFGLAASLPALAIEPPTDDAPPPPSVKTPASAPVQEDTGAAPRQRIVPPTAENQQTAFIGIISADVPEVLSTHLGIGAGEGVLVRDVAPDSPAHKAGIEKHDVILRVSGKSVGSPLELSKQISERKPDEEITLDFIHKGKETTKTVKLEARTSFTRSIQPRGFGREEPLNLDGLPQEQADRIRDMIEQRLRGMRDQQRDFERQFDSLSPRRGGERRGNNEGLKGFHFKSDATFRLMDNDGSIEIKSSDGNKDIVVRDRDNNEVWSGPWNTEEDKAAAPKDIRERVDKFKMDENFRGGGLKFRFGPGFQDDSETR